MAKQEVKRKFTVNAVGILDIENGVLSIEVEDVGTFRLDKLLAEFDGYPVKINVSYEESQESPEDIVDPETGEVLE